MWTSPSFSSSSTGSPMATGLPSTRPAGRPGVPAEVAHTVTFEALAGDRTLMRVREAGYTSDQAIEMSRQGLEGSLDKLTPLFAGGDVVL